jgi:hypothetical protein
LVVTLRRVPQANGMPSGKLFDCTEAALEPDILRPARGAGIDHWPDGLVRDAIG